MTPSRNERLSISIRRCLAWIPLAFLSACAVQQPAEPPAPAAIPAAPEVAAPAPAEPAPAVEIAPPSSDTQAALQAWVDRQNRLYRVAAPLLIDNTELCPRDTRNLLGLTAKNRYSYTQKFAANAYSALGLSDRLRVMNVLPGSGAAQAGVRKGDILLAVEGNALPQGPHAERDSAVLVSNAIRGRSDLNLTLLRDGKRSTIRVPLTRACAFGVELGNARRVNSYADGHRVLITQGMLNFVQSDEELAYVLAKEFAHSVLTTSPRADMGTMIDRLRLFGIEPKGPGGPDIKPYSPVLDATADKLALYMLVRAGYPIDNALAFWKRLAGAYPETVADGHTALHPSTSYRMSVMTEIAKTIKTKQDKKLPLIP